MTSWRFRIKIVELELQAASEVRPQIAEYTASNQQRSEFPQMDGALQWLELTPSLALLAH